ncbi:MAG: hypothetical protein WDN45_16650 [Caulobacteraceae bacterium]
MLGALHERHATGKGRLVEVSMIEAMAHFNLDDFTHLFSADLVIDALQPAARVPVLCVRMPGWALDRPAHVLAPQVLEQPGAGGGPAAHAGGPALRPTAPRAIDNYEQVLGLLAPIFKTRPLAQWWSA